MLIVIFVVLAVLPLYLYLYYIHSPLQIKIKLLNTDAVIPIKGTPYASCYDIIATETVTILPGETKVIPTGIAVELPPNIDARMHARSSYRRQGLDVLGEGIIDNDYRGELSMLLHNHSTQPFTIQRSNKCGQIEFTRTLCTKLIQVDTLQLTQRGSGGFGSTGK